MKENEIEFYQIEDYILAANFSRKIRIHGGVTIYVKKGVPFSPIHKLNVMCSELHGEIAGVFLNSRHTVVLRLYGSPHGDLNEFCDIVEKALTHIKIKFNPVSIIVAGD